MSAESGIAPIPGYTLLRPLGRGGMATVYLAVQESLGREVALKLLAPAAGDDAATAGERFLREARIAASLHHPHIVAIHDFGVHQGLAYLAMEYEPGGTIAPMAGEKLAPREALRLVRDIAGALDYAHGRGVVHRDIKPDNILRRADGAAVLSDFGIARLMLGESVLTTEGTSVGTPQYMSPEQLRGEKVDGRSDLYSLGVVLFQLLTGELPYTGSDGWAIGAQHINAPVPRLPAELAHLQALLDALLAKAPAQRLQGGAELVQRIDALLAASTTPAATVTLSPAGVERRAPAAPRSRPHGPVFAAIALLLVLGGLAWRHFAVAPAAPAPPAIAAPAAGPAVAPESIAVLPFVDMSQAHDQEYFSDGLSEELLNQLAQVPQLRVIARTSSFAFKGKDVPVADIARALKVDHVLEGSVRKSGNTLRVTAQLIRTSDSSQLWSQAFDRDLTDVFKVQDEIAREVVSALKVKMLPGALTDATQYTRSPAAYEQYLLGKDAGRVGGRAAVEASLAAFERAIAIDPGYANAHAERSVQQGSMADFAETPAAREQWIAASLASADRAIALAPQLPIGYVARGNILHRMRWDWQGAQEALARAAALDPTNSRGLNNYGAVLFSLGRQDEGLAVLRRAVVTDPLSDGAWNQLARHLHAAGRKAEAEQAFHRALALNPLQNWSNFLLGNLLLSEGRVDEAVAHYQQAPEQFRSTGMAMAEFTRGHEAASRALLDKMEKEYAIGFAFQIAQVYAWRGERDRAFEWLDRAYALHDFGMVRLSFDPAMDPLRKDPRFAALVAKMGFPK